MSTVVSLSGDADLSSDSHASLLDALTGAVHSDHLRDAGLLGEVDNVGVLLNALASLSEGISVFDANKCLLAYNERYKELFDYPDELLKPGTPLRNFIYFNALRGEYGEGDTNILADKILETAAICSESRYMRHRPDGRVIAVEGRPMRDGGFVTLFTEVTEQYKAEQALRCSEARMRRQTAALHKISMAPPVLEGDVRAALAVIGRIVSETLDLTRLAIWLGEEETPDVLKCWHQINRGQGFFPEDTVIWREDSYGYLDALAQEGLLAFPCETPHVPPRFYCFAPHETDLALIDPTKLEGLDVAIRISGQMRGVIALEKRRVFAQTPGHEAHLAAMSSSWHLDEENFAEAVGQLIAMLLVARDRQKTELFAEKLSNTDSLTGLSNRNRFLDHLEQALMRSQRDSVQGALLMVDLDNFKDVNDMISHEAGDELLRVAAGRIQSCVRQSDIVARLGGDEYGILLHKITNIDDVVLLAERIQKSLEALIDIQGMAIESSGSIGISIFPDDGQDVGMIQQHAEMAMYQAKEAGQGNLRFFSPEIGVKIRQRSDLRRELRSALEEQQLRLYFQPKIDMQSGIITGAEALLRWEHPTRGLVPPDEFIPLAEQSGLIIPIGIWVLREACRQTRIWHEKGHHPFQMAVNLSSMQFRRGDIVETVQKALEDHALTPESLQLEITESVLLHDDAQVFDRVTELGNLGMDIALDDFGTGYSSLSYLKRFNVDVVKIDKSFVADLGHGRDDAPIIRAVVALARSLNIRVVAEGIETASQESFLRALGCDSGQGFLYSRPLSARDFEKLLEQRVK